MCWFVETFFLVRWTHAMGPMMSCFSWFHGLVQSGIPLWNLGNKKLALEPQKKTPRGVGDVLIFDFFPERLGEGRFLGAVSLSSMT